MSYNGSTTVSKTANVGSIPATPAIFKKLLQYDYWGFFNAFSTKYTPVLGVLKVLRWDGGSRTKPRIPIEAHREAHEIRLVGGNQTTLEQH